MVTSSDYPPLWAIHKDARLTIGLEPCGWSNKPVIEVIGNKEGFLSLGNLLLWLCDSPADNDVLSLTGLSFVTVKSSLSLCVVQPFASDALPSLSLLDKAHQFEWRIGDDLLQTQGLVLLSMAFEPDHCSGSHAHGVVGSESEYELVFIRDDIK